MSFILRRTLMRPRDALAYVNECLSLAVGKPRATWAEIASAERAYSRNRLLALRDEWKPSYPKIDRFLNYFQSSPIRICRDDLTRIFENAALLPADPEFLGVRWMTELSATIWNGLDSDDWITVYQPMVAFLFHIGFLGCVRPGEAMVFSHEQPEFVDQASNLAGIDEFSVHPAFHAALDILPEASD